MKKIISLFILVCIMFSVSACGNEPVQQKETTGENSVQSPVLVKQSTTESQIKEPESYSVSQTQFSAETGDGVIEVKYYRDNYYSIAAPFVYIVGKDVYREWKETQPNPDETNVMLMVNFIRDFNISREDFDKANIEYAWRIKNLLNGTPVMNPKDFANQEDEEVYNADIIYTFDNELINKYYLTPDYPFLFKDEYEDAVENSTYQTQTTDFIEVPEERPWPESSNLKADNDNLTESEPTE